MPGLVKRKLNNMLHESDIHILLWFIIVVGVADVDLFMTVCA